MFENFETWTRSPQLGQEESVVKEERPTTFLQERSVKLEHYNGVLDNNVYITVVVVKFPRTP